MPGIKYLLGAGNDELKRFRERNRVVDDSLIGRKRKLQLALTESRAIVRPSGIRFMGFAHSPPPVPPPPVPPPRVSPSLSPCWDMTEVRRAVTRSCASDT